MAMEIEDNEFFLVRLSDENTIHKTESGAIDHLRDRVSELNPDSDDVSVVRVSIEGEDWTIAELSWQSIALRLMEGE